MGERMGGHVVAESLAALGAEVAFGVPGIHALAIWEGLRTGPIRVYGTRTELAAGFAADGYARSTRHPAPLLLSTGPGALNSLTAMMEAASSHVPLVAISSQIPADLIGRGRGYRPAEDNKSPDQPIGVIPIDSIFSPVRRVAYAVEQARVGQRTDFDKLTLDIETDGSVDPQAALREAKEESGLDVELLGERPPTTSPGTRALIAPRFLDIHRINETHEHIGLIYWARPKVGSARCADRTSQRDVPTKAQKPSALLDMRR